MTAFAGIAMPERIVRGGPVKGKTIQVEVEDHALILVDFGNAAFAVTDSTYGAQAAKGPRSEFYGSEGTIILNERGADTLIELYREDERLDIRGWLPVQVDGGRTGWSLASGVEHLADCIREGRQPLISAEHARHCLELMLKAMEAARTGVAQDLSTTF